MYRQRERGTGEQERRSQAEGILPPAGRRNTFPQRLGAVRLAVMPSAPGQCAL